MKKYEVILLAILISKIVMAQSVLNGNFEINYTDSCTYNLNDSVFNATMPCVTSFSSDDGGIDILNGECHDLFDTLNFFGNAQSGMWYLALETIPVNYYDAIAMKTSEPIVAGQNYSMSYYEKANLTYISTISNIQIGISEDSTSFGTLLYTSTPETDIWSNETFYFTSPISGNYITVRMDSTIEGWNFIDNFVLSNVSGTYENNQTIDTRLYPNPAVDQILVETQEAVEIKITNIFGHILFQSNNLNSVSKEINISHFSPGTYICYLISDKKMVIKVFNKI
jgi:hypothetical protein